MGILQKITNAIDTYFDKYNVFEVLICGAIGFIIIYMTQKYVRNYLDDEGNKNVSYLKLSKIKKIFIFLAETMLIYGWIIMIWASIALVYKTYQFVERYTLKSTTETQCMMAHYELTQQIDKEQDTKNDLSEETLSDIKEHNEMIEESILSLVEYLDEKEFKEWQTQMSEYYINLE